MYGVGRDAEKSFEWTTFASVGMDDHLAYHYWGNQPFLFVEVYVTLSNRF